MWRGDEVFKREQWVVSGRLVLEYVRCRRREPFRLERLVERLLVDDSASRCIDESRGRLHHRQLGRADEVAIGLDQGDVHRYEVRATSSTLNSSARSTETTGS